MWNQLRESNKPIIADRMARRQQADSLGLFEIGMELFAGTNKGKDIIALDGYQYIWNKRLVRNLRWKCRNRLCKGAIWTDFERSNPELRTAHDPTCASDQEGVTLSKCRAQLKTAVRGNITQTVPALYTQHVDALQIQNAATRARFPPLFSVESTLNRARSAHRPPLPHTLQDVNIPEQYRTTTAGQPFVLHESDDKSFIIFATDDNIRRLAQLREWCMDGTFDSVPSKPTQLWQQLYTIHAFYRDKLLPLVYCLLTEKTAATYTRVFRILKDRANILGVVLNPSKFRSDFETGLMPALTAEFPNVPIKGCHFHFCQAIYRNVQRLGLQTDYQDNEEFRQLVKELMALAFLPLNDVLTVYGALQMEHALPLAQLAAPLFAYFQRQWMQNTPLELWNVHEETRRTNNNIEGWHSRFNKLTKSHPDLYLFLKSVNMEQGYTEGIIAQMEAGVLLTRTNQTYKRLNQRISTLTVDLNTGIITPRGYIRGIAHNITQPLQIALI